MRCVGSGRSRVRGVVVVVCGGVMVVVVAVVLCN